ncbi:MAG: tetraacyldisaccharide 4'-kinase [Gemmataceae bacterium]
MLTINKCVSSISCLFSADAFQQLVSGTRRGCGARLLRGLLWWARVPYACCVSLRNVLYDIHCKRIDRAPVPVISVGNLTLGGTGKTPCVEYIAKRFLEWDCRIAVLSRGYGANGGMNDEALVLEQNLPAVPHLQGADRVALSRVAAEELESEIILLDDGFQHRRLARDVDLVLIDVTNPWGYGYLFPRGLLREPRRGLRRASAFLLTRCDHVSDVQLRDVIFYLERHFPRIPVIQSTHNPIDLLNAVDETVPLSTLVSQPVVAFCGIGNPAAFRRTLENLHVRLIDFRSYPDHHDYSRQDIAELRTWAAGHGSSGLVLTTQKDLVKINLSQLGTKPLWAVRIGLNIVHGQERLDKLLRSVLETIRKPAPP